MVHRENVPLEGELNCWTRGFDMPDVLLGVCETGMTGLLRFVSAEAEKTLFIRSGEIIFAKSTSLDDRLGEYLLRRGQISIADLTRVATEVRPGRRLGTILVENNIMDPKELVQAVIGQVRAIILSLFRWTEAWFGFNEQDLPNETITLNMPTARLIIDGIQLIDSWRRIAQGVGELSSVYRKVSGNEDDLRSINLDAATLEVLALLSQPRSVEQVCATSRLLDLEVCRHLWVFRCLGWIEQTDEAVPSGISIDPTAKDGEQTSPVEDEPAAASEDPGGDTAAVSEAPSPTEPTPPPERSESPLDVPQAPSIVGSMADLQETGTDAADGGIGESVPAAASAFETDDPVPPSQPSSTPGGALDSKPEDVEAIPVVEGGGAPSETSPPEGDEVPVIEGATVPPGASPMDTGEEPVVEGIVAEAAGDGSGTEEGSKKEPEQPAPAAEDMDFEGLGMVLGDENGK